MTSTTKRPRVVWVGNKATKELHRLVTGEAHPGQCHFDEIRKENKQTFRTAKEARANGFDVSAFCTTRHFKSRDNK
jgi:hypothetical protein